MWISYPATEQHELVLAVLRYNLAAISGQRGVTDLFETICGRIAYFDYLGVLASMAVHSVTVRETPLCAPSLHNVEVGPQLSSIIAREACHPFRDSDISGDEVPNDLYASGRIQISVGPCSGGKTYTFIETNVSNRVHVGLGGLPCATQYSFDPGGRTLFPVIPAEVKKTGSAFVSTIRATQEALRALAPNIHDQLLFDEFAGGVSNEGGEFEVAETLLKGLAQIGCTITYITHNTLLATHFSELGLPSAVLLHAGIDHHLGGPILTYQQRVGPPDWGLYAEHLEKLIRAHKPNWWIDDSAPPGME
jgi:hypothetical protein